ncbi:hypothetical protein KKH23_06430 [Patescibacteria group bacterium]|uniref:Uncharacterized protein n=1 Tax=viral metagenome TaxID=1070528 RepID=A0A6M3MBE6_9ZZZZ|nr:hypothetical protein [Patescibacteria group bacterium]
MSGSIPKIGGFITLQQIVMDVLSDLGIYDLSNYTRFLKWAARGYTKLNLYDLSNIEVVRLTMSTVGTVTLPDDFIDYTKIGIEDSRGNVYVLGLNDDMILNRTEVCSQSVNSYFNSESDTAVLDGYIFAPYFNDGEYVTLYGISGGFADSYYRVDRERGYIQFSSSVPNGTVILEYISSGISVKGNTYIPREAQETIIAWIHWKYRDFSPQYNLSQVAMAKQTWIEERHELRDFVTIPTMQEIQDVFYESYKQTIKR